MISALMGQSYRNGTPLPDHEVAHIMIALLMAGQHTSSATAAWALLHLADKRDVAWVPPFSTRYFEFDSAWSVRNSIKSK